MQQIVDSVMKRALLGAELINSSAVRPRSEVLVRIQQVYRTNTTVYIHYKIENHGRRLGQEIEIGECRINLANLSGA